MSRQIDVEAGTPGTLAPQATVVDAIRAEWIKLVTVRSTRWTVAGTFVLGVGLTVLVCWVNAERLGSPESSESPGSFITWGVMVAQLGAVVVGALAVTGEYGTGMIRSSLTAVPVRRRVLVAKSVVVASVMFVVGTATALVGYWGANPFLEREGVGMALEGDVARSMYGSGLYLAGLALFAVAVGFVLRHTAATISVLLALMVVLANLANLVPGVAGEWIVKLLPGNAGSAIAAPVPFNPDLLDPWTGYAVFVAEAAVLLAGAYVLLKRRDA